MRPLIDYGLTKHWTWGHAVGSYWNLQVGQVAVLSGKNYVPDDVMLLFSERDRFVDRDRLLPILEPPADADDSDDRPASAHVRLVGYRCSVHALRARLELQGFGYDRVRQEAIEYIDAERADPERYTFDPEQEAEFERKYDASTALLDACVSQVRRQSLSRYVRRLEEPPSPEELYIDGWWRDLREGFDDPRFALALLLRPARANTVAMLDLSDLVLGGWLEADELLSASARARLEATVGSSGQIIVVTEGSSDANLMARAISLARPELDGLFAFLDFATTAAPGGADRVVSLVRGMAAAGVLNRVVAILDNDAAGRAAAQLLERSNLPARFSVALLPDVDYARSYPTIGPTGRVNADINGRACSIELMFGLTLLREATGDLPPVRWGGYISSVAEYQGEIAEKSAVQAKLRAMLGSAIVTDVNGEIADGCRRLAEVIVGGASAALPPMSSDLSPLLKWRVTESA